MKLKDFLSLIIDEDVRIELELDIEEEDEYLYTSFWLSDYRKGISAAKRYEDWEVESISFGYVIDSAAKMTIQIKEK